MDERLVDLQRRVGAVRIRLEEAVRRLGALRARLRQEGDAGGSAAEAAPLFEGPGAAPGGLDDVELHFEALNTDYDSEGPKREER